jgi:Lon protease-like protein
MKTPGERLVTSIAMICPFEPSEKQALLEAPRFAERARLLCAVVEMAAADLPHDGAGPRH